MRRLACHRADAEIDARLAEISGQELRMRVGDVQDARIAEMLEIVDASFRAAHKARQAGSERCGARHFKDIPAADGHGRQRAILQKALNGFQDSSRLLSRSPPGKWKPWPKPPPPLRRRRRDRSPPSPQPSLHQ